MKQKKKVGTQVVSGKEKVKAGTEIANQCGTLLETIVTEVSSISKMAEEISVASNEQAQGVSEITKAITQLDTVTQQNSSSSEETASAAEELSAQAESLNVAVLDLVAAIEGANKAPVQSHSKSAEVRSLPVKKVTASHSPMKKASGHEIVPDCDHSGFQDV